MKKSQSLLCASIVLALAGFSVVASAQNYPTKPVRFIVPFPPGGSNDIVGRLMAQELTERLGKQVVVDNRGGAGGVLG
ncbi:MAG TPA: tripartite tricarboxylate transporter substrate binding protein, partial [Burkholderiales bacterium]